MKEPVILGIDIGTSGIRAAAINQQGQIVALTQSSLFGRAGEHVRNPESWKQALTKTLTQVCNLVPPDSIEAVSVDGTSGTILALDSSSRPLGDAFMYNDMVKDQCILEKIRSIAPDNSAVHSSSSALARFMILQNRKRVARIVHQADWIAELLAGESVPSDESNALKTGYDPIDHCWPDWLRDVGVRAALLPPVVTCGALTAVGKGTLGLPTGIAIHAGMTDGCASFFATGATDIGDGVTALGTTMTVKLLSDHPVFAPEYGIYSHRVGDIWLAGGASNSGGGVLEQFFSAEAIEQLSTHIDPNKASGLDYYPLPGIGERFPINDSELQPSLSPRPADDVDFLHGLLEGVASVEALGYRKLAALGAPLLKRMYTVGGGSGNRTWEAIRCRIVGAQPALALSSEAAVGMALYTLRYGRGADK